MAGGAPGQKLRPQVPPPRFPSLKSHLRAVLVGPKARPPPSLEAFLGEATIWLAQGGVQAWTGALDVHGMTWVRGLERTLRGGHWAPRIPLPHSSQNWGLGPEFLSHSPASPIGATGHRRGPFRGLHSHARAGVLVGLTQRGALQQACPPTLHPAEVLKVRTIC